MTAEEINQMILLADAHTQLFKLTNMESRCLFEFLIGRGYSICPPISPPDRQPKKDFSIVT